MNGTNDNPLIPASLAADGMQGAETAAVSDGDAQDSVFAHVRHVRDNTHRGNGAMGLHLARVAVNRAREQLNCYALTTDNPRPGVVEAADLLDAAALCLAQARQFPDLKKNTLGGGR